jgi:hypothetical protein
MKKLGFLVAAVAAFAFTTSPTFACDHEAKAGDKDSKPMACAKGKDAKKMACCAKKGEKDAAKDGKSCPGHAAGEKHDAKCAGKGDAKKTEVSMTGKVLCEHCDLHKKDHCNPVFQAEGSADYLSICPDTDIAAVKKAGNDGKAILDVKGFMCETKKGEKMLMISSFAVKS